MTPKQRNQKIVRNQQARNDPARQMFQTHEFSAGAAIVTADSFPVRSAPIAFAFTYASDGSETTDIVTIGSASRQFKVSVDGLDLNIVAGGAGTEQAALSLSGAFPAADVKVRFMVSVRPGDGRLWVHRDGKRYATAQASGGDFNGDWADDTDGSTVMELDVYQGQTARGE